MAKKLDIYWQTTPSGKKQYGYWDDFAALKKELKNFIKDQNLKPGIMPSSTLLRATGRADLFHAIQQHGGQIAVARKLGLQARKAAAGYKMPLGALRTEIRKLARSVGAPGYMPSQSEFLQAGRLDLLRAIRTWGGAAKVAKRLRLKIKPGGPRQPKANKDIAWLKAQLLTFVKARKLNDRMPSARELLAAGRRDLYNAVRLMGGFARMAEVMGWVPAGKAHLRQRYTKDASVAGEVT